VLLSSTADPWPSRIESHPGGGATASWMDVSDGVHVQRVLADGSIVAGWPAGGVVLPPDDGAKAVYQQIRCDASGNVYVGWIGEPFYRLRMTKLTSSGAIAAGWNASGLLIRDAFFAPDFSLTLVCGSTPALAWYEQSGLSGSGYDVRVQRVTPGGSPEWTQGGVLVTSAARDQISPAITGTGPCGQVAVAWCDDRDTPEDFDVYGAKILNDGGIVAVGENLPPRSTFAIRLTGANPSRGPMSCALTLGTSQRISADVLDVAGRQVRVLAEGESRGSGTSRLEWDGRAADGRAVASGLYVVRVRSGAAMTQARFIVAR